MPTFRSARRACLGLAVLLASTVYAGERMPFFGNAWICHRFLLPRYGDKPALFFAGHIPDDASFEVLQGNWSGILRSVWLDYRLLDPYIDAMRLINEPDWEKAILELPNHPYRSYGKVPIDNFYALVNFVRFGASNEKLDSNLLRKIHSIAMAHLPFHGFEGRRILLDYKAGKFDEAEFRARLKRAYEKNEEVAGVSHASLGGKYRSDPIDRIEHRGSEFDEKGARYFSPKELASLRANPYLTVDEASIVPFGDRGFKGVVYYLDPSLVEAAVDREIATRIANIRSLAASGAPIAAVVKEIFTMERNLISIHPFLDGNGRSVRGFSDVILQRYGLPPPLFPNEADLTLTIDETLEANRKLMVRTIQAWEPVLHPSFFRKRGFFGK